MDSAVIELLAIFALILANGFFAASEFALIASRRSRILNLVRRGNKRAARTRDLLRRPDKFLAAIQVGITFVATLAGVFSGATLVETITPAIREFPVAAISNTAHGVAIALVVIFISVLSVVIGELIPKYIALSNPEKIAMRVTRPISLFSKATFVIVGTLTGAAKLIIRLMGYSRLPERDHITEDEINILISEGTEKGVFDKTEQKLIRSVFQFTDTTVRQSMTPRVDIVGIQTEWPQQKILETMTKNGFSRYPVYEESLDEIKGIVYTKDLISLMVLGEVIILRDIIRKAVFVPDSMPLTTLLRRFQKRKKHIAIVLDEFGGTAGLITLEDILEEIVGEIQDEHDQDQPEFVAHSDKVAFAAANFRVDELNESFAVRLPTDISDTLGGLLVEELGRIPGLSEQVRVRDLKFTVLEMDGSRIKRLRVEKP